MKFTLLLTIAALSVVAAKTLPGQTEWLEVPLTDSVHHQQVLDVLGGSRSGRITNGENAVDGQLPYIAGVFPFFNVTGGIFCGGSVISPSFILTAAHCLVDMTRAEIYAGLIHADPFNPNRRTAYRASITDVNNFITHPSYNRVTRNNDIGLIRLVRNIPFSNLVSAIALPSRSDIGSSFINTQVTLAGFGHTSDNPTERNWNLRFVTQTIINNDECVRLYGNIVTQDNICNAGTGGRSSCQGDGGGPVALTRNGSPVQIGIINFGSALGCERGFAQVNVRLTSYLDWIQTNTGIIIQ